MTSCNVKCLDVGDRGGGRGVSGGSITGRGSIGSFGKKSLYFSSSDFLWAFFSSVSTTTFSSTFLQVSLLAILLSSYMLLLERIDRFPFFLSLEEFSYKQCEVFALYQIPCGPSILSDLGCILQ